MVSRPCPLSLIQRWGSIWSEKSWKHTLKIHNLPRRHTIAVSLVFLVLVEVTPMEPPPSCTLENSMPHVLFFCCINIHSLRPCSWATHFPRPSCFLSPPQPADAGCLTCVLRVFHYRGHIKCHSWSGLTRAELLKGLQCRKACARLE